MSWTRRWIRGELWLQKDWVSDALVSVRMEWAA